MALVRKVRPKSRCCKSRPRCKRCPVVLKRLEKAGYARKTAKGNYKVLDPLPKAVRKAARAR